MPRAYVSRFAIHREQAERLRDLLRLVDGELSRIPSVATIQRWPAADYLAVEHWAARTHLRASDNVVSVPPFPEVLQGYRRRRDSPPKPLRLRRRPRRENRPAAVVPIRRGLSE